MSDEEKLKRRRQRQVNITSCRLFSRQPCFFSPTDQSPRTATGLYACLDQCPEYVTDSSHIDVNFRFIRVSSRSRSCESTIGDEQLGKISHIYHGDRYASCPSIVPATHNQRRSNSTVDVDHHVQSEPIEEGPIQHASNVLNLFFCQPSYFLRTNIEKKKAEMVVFSSSF